MKKNVIAVMLSLVIAVGSVGTAVPAFAAEEGTTVEEGATTEVAAEERGEAEKTEDGSAEVDSKENAEDAEQTESAYEEVVATNGEDAFSEYNTSEDNYNQSSENQDTTSGTEEESVTGTDAPDRNEYEVPEVSDDIENLAEEDQNLDQILEAQEKVRVWKHANQITISYDTAEDFLLRYSIYDQNTDDLLYGGKLQQAQEGGYYYAALDFDAINKAVESRNADDYEPIDITDVPVKVVLDDGTYQYEEVISGKAGTIFNLEVDSKTDGQLSVTWDSSGETDGFYLAARGTEESQPLPVCVSARADDNEAILNISKEDVRGILAVPYKFDWDTGAKYYGEAAVLSLPEEKNDSETEQMTSAEEAEIEQEVLIDEQIVTEASDIAAKARIYSGTCGKNLTWTLDSEGTLTISGTGDMNNYPPPYSNIPWDTYKNSSYSPIKSVKIASGVTSIGEYAFEDCRSLTSVTIPDSVAYIGEGAFNGCNSLTSVTIPGSVTRIDDFLFEYCSSLTSVTIPNSVTSIGRSAFFGCSSLTSVTIPKSVTRIREFVFWNCDNFSDIYYVGNYKEWKQIKLENDDIPSNVTIHYNWTGEVPADGVQYITATLGEEIYKYEGKPVEPKPTVTLTLTTEDGTETKELSQNEYTITYENNDKPGKATLTVTGTGEYSGLSDRVEFTIDSVVEIRYITVVLDSETYKYEGKSVEPKPTVTLYETTEDGEEKKELTASEYTITYKDNDKPGKATLTVTGAGDYSGLSSSVFFTITEEVNLKITQPSGGDNYAFAGNVQKKKTFTVTLDQAEEEPKKSDFKFEIKKSGNLNTTPSNEVSDPAVEVLNIKKTADRKYSITFDYAPDETGFYGLTVSYKDNVDDAELMVYDSNILEKLEADLDGTVNKYYKSYSKRVSKEIKKLMEETEEEPDYVQLAQKLMQDSSNVLGGTQIGDSHVDKDSVDLCAFEAYARFIYQTGGRSGVRFDEVENKTAASKIVNTINGYIKDNHGVTESDVPLDSKVIIDGKEYSAKAAWNIWAFGAGQIFVKVVDKNGNVVKSYENSITSLKEANAATANYCEALKDLEISSMKNIANCWYMELVDVLGWDILKDVDDKRQEMIKVVSDDITQGLEKRGIKNILDNIKSCHTYYKQAREFIEKLEKLDNVFKNPKSTSEMILSVYRIKNMDTLSLEPGDCSKDIYDLVKNAEEKWREYMYEYFTTGTVKELEPDTVLNFDVLKNGVKNIFNCPINITVYDPSGNISGYIGDDDLWFNDDIFIKEEGDTKIIYTPKTGGYHFGVTGTGHGMVSYTAEELSDGVANGSRLNYYDMPVEIGTEINIGLNSGSLSSGADISVNTPDSSYEPETVDHSSAITVTVDNDSEKGTVTGAGPYVAGDVVTLTATPTENYYFVGWYENDQLKSYKKSYRFVARRDITLTARYIERKEDEENLNSGTCGENVTWSLNEEGTLVISGTGEMADYSGREEIDLEVTYSSNSPWFDYDIKTVIIEDGVTSIGRAAFCGCGKLERVEIPDSVTTIGIWAFSGCGSLDCIKIPEGVTIIGEKLFAYCINLRSVTIPDGVRSIDNCAFESCEKLTGVEIPSTVTTIGNWAFISCNSLTDIIIPEGIKTISIRSFENCSNLVSVTIPNSVTSIKRDAFKNCYGLTDIYYGGSRKGWDAISIGDNNTALTDATLHLSLSGAEVSGLTNKAYTGKALTQSPVVTLCGETLTEGTDYSVSYANNTDIGTATVTITGTGNYKGTATATFMILPGKTTRGDMFNLANNVKVTWKEVPGAKYYKVYREGVTDQKESRKEPVIITSGLVGWDKDPGLTNGHAYRYKIVASQTGRGDPSGDSTLSYSKLMYRLKTVVIRSVKNTAPGKVTVKYDKTTSGDSYVLQYCERQGMVGAKTKVVLGANNTSYVIGGLKKGKTYYISIRVRKKVNGIDYYTTFGVPKKVTVTK